MTQKGLLPSYAMLLQYNNSRKFFRNLKQLVSLLVLFANIFI